MAVVLVAVFSLRLRAQNHLVDQGLNRLPAHVAQDPVEMRRTHALALRQLDADGAKELDQIGIIDKTDVLDSTVLRMPKTYPAYFGAYSRFSEIRSFVDVIENLFLVGRNGMHKYNNQDHSMLTAMIAVDNIISGIIDKSNLWDVNTEMEYHETQNDREKATAVEV